MGNRFPTLFAVVAASLAVSSSAGTYDVFGQEIADGLTAGVSVQLLYGELWAVFVCERATRRVAACVGRCRAAAGCCLARRGLARAA